MKVNVIVGHVVDYLLDELVRDERVAALYKTVFRNDLQARIGKPGLGTSNDEGYARGILTGKEAVSLFIDEVLSCLLRSRFESAGEGQIGHWESFWCNL